jgi:hypothetical protein
MNTREGTSPKIAAREFCERWGLGADAVHHLRELLIDARCDGIAIGKATNEADAIARERIAVVEHAREWSRDISAEYCTAFRAMADMVNHGEHVSGGADYVAQHEARIRADERRKTLERLKGLTDDQEKHDARIRSEGERRALREVLQGLGPIGTDGEEWEPEEWEPGDLHRFVRVVEDLAGLIRARLAQLQGEPKP